MYTGKIEPQNVTRLVLDASRDTLELPDIQLIIQSEQVSQEVNVIKVYKKDKKSNSEELF